MSYPSIVPRLSTRCHCSSSGESLSLVSRPPPAFFNRMKKSRQGTRLHVESLETRLYISNSQSLLPCPPHTSHDTSHTSHDPSHTSHDYHMTPPRYADTPLPHSTILNLFTQHGWSLATAFQSNATPPGSTSTLPSDTLVFTHPNIH